MNESQLQSIAALLVRCIGLVIIIYSLFCLFKSPALMERSVGQDRTLDFNFATFIVAGKTFVLSPKSARIIIFLLYLIPVTTGLLLIWKSRLFGGLLCIGLK